MSIESLLAKLNETEKDACYPARINKLRGAIETDSLESGIAEAVRVLDKGVRSFVIYGEPQSGKTEFMIALTCKLIDLGYETIFVIMNDNTELENQNFDRFRNATELDPVPVRDSQLQQMTSNELRKNKQRIIFCRKNSMIPVAPE